MQEDSFIPFHIERVLGHRVDDKYPLALYLRAQKELVNHFESKNRD